MLYFAYGSNCYFSRMKKRCPSAEVVGIDYIEGFVMKFNKEGVDGTAKANIVREKGRTYGVVYSIDKKDVESLDVAEGLDVHYYKRQVRTKSGKKCITYIALDEKVKEGLFPSSTYKWLVVQGLLSSGVDAEYVKKVGDVKVAVTKSIANLVEPVYNREITPLSCGIDDVDDMLDRYPYLSMMKEDRKRIEAKYIIRKKKDKGVK